MLCFAKRDKAMTLQRYMPTFFQAEGSEERWAGMREDSQDGAWYAVADVDQRVSQLEWALRDILALADISKPVDADALTAAVRRGWVALQSETLPRRAHSKSEFKRLTALGVERAPPETAAESHDRLQREQGIRAGSAPETPAEPNYNWPPYHLSKIVPDCVCQGCARLKAANYASHKSRSSDSSLYDEVCDDCGARDYTAGPDELSAAPCSAPETACTCDSTLVTDTSNHQPHCPRYVAKTEPKRKRPLDRSDVLGVGPTEIPAPETASKPPTKFTGPAGYRSAICEHCGRMFMDHSEDDLSCPQAKTGTEHG
jgi:hypothetical protein